MFPFLKLSLLTGVAGTAVAVPTLLTFKNQINTENNEHQEIGPEEERANGNQAQDEGYSVTLSEVQEEASEKKETAKFCKEVVRSEEHNGRLMACRSGKEDYKVTFNYIADLVADTYPYEVTGIRLTYNSVIAELKEKLEHSDSK